MSTTAYSPVNQLDERESRWFAVYTRYKREKMVDRRLSEKGIQTYLPLLRVTRYYTRKVKHFDLPLISCYVFAKITKKEYVPVLEDPDVVQFVRIAQNLISIPEREIDIMRRVVGEGVEVEVAPSDFFPGAEVEIVGGRLTGLRGFFVEKYNDKKFIVELESLGYSLRMEVAPSLLHPTGRRRGQNVKSM
jgi:transcription antitermination factor NusG